MQSWLQKLLCALSFICPEISFLTCIHCDPCLTLDLQMHDDVFFPTTKSQKERRNSSQGYRESQYYVEIIPS